MGEGTVSEMELEREEILQALGKIALSSGETGTAMGLSGPRLYIAGVLCFLTARKRSSTSAPSQSAAQRRAGYPAAPAGSR